MSGYLKVLSSDSNWETRYVALEGATLKCWKKKEDKAAGVAPVKELDLQCATLREIDEPNTWSVHPGKSEASYFQADNEQRKNEWINALRHYNCTVASSQKVSLKDFEKRFVLGKGSYGKVYMVIKKDTGKAYAMKEMNAEKMKQAEIRAPFTERLILQEIDHPFIVHLHYSFQEAGNLYMILDLLGGGELFTYIENHAPLPEEVGKYYAAEVATALGYLHSRNIIYRDLKPENVVFDLEGHACLTDFGLAKANVFEANAVTYCGTNEYLAPELLKGVPHGKAVDWWSLGLMMCEVIFNELPFYDENPVQMQTRILLEEVKFPKLKVPVSEPTKDLIRRLLDKDPDRRLQTLEEFEKHPCFEGLDFDLLLQRKIPPPIKPDSDPARNFSPEFTGETFVAKEAPPQAVVTLAGYTYDGESQDLEESPTASASADDMVRTSPKPSKSSVVTSSENRTGSHGPASGAASSSNGLQHSTDTATVKPAPRAAPVKKPAEQRTTSKGSLLPARKNLVGCGNGSTGKITK